MTEMEQLQWLVRLGDGAVLFIQMAFWVMAVFHLIYAGRHVKRHPVRDERVNTFWKVLLNGLLVPMVYLLYIAFFLLRVPLLLYFPASIFVMMPAVAWYYRSRDAAGMWAAVAICGFYILLVLIAVYGFDAMEPYGYRGSFEYWDEE